MLHVSEGWRDSGSLVNPLCCCSGLVELCLPSFSYPVGPPKESVGFIIGLAELVRKASFPHLEFSPSLFNVDSVT